MSSTLEMVKEPKSEWGGLWTQKKLEAFSKYVWSYLTIMKKFPYWKTVYFDGFAGSGSRVQRSDILKQLSISVEEERVYRGSAGRVLDIRDQLTFDYYYFIDTRAASLNKLEERLSRNPSSKGKRLEYRSGDANQELLKLATALKSKKLAALVFLDPFGMQIDWDSIASLQGTRSDVWILVPTGVIVNRLLDRKGELTNLKKLESFFGLTEAEIRSAFYEKQTRQTLFGTEEITSKITKPIEQIASLYGERLGQIWKYVTPKPLRLNNSTGAPIFHFVFASNNMNAMKIAQQIIEKA